MEPTLNTPELRNITTFDARNEYIFIFNYHDSQATGNQLIIKNAITGEEIYNKRTDENYYQLQHKLPARSLANGREYSAQVKVFHKKPDGTEEESNFSAPKNFYCYATPVMTITRPTDNMELGASEIEVQMTYGGTNINNGLDHYVVNLFDSNNQLIRTSGNIYDVSNLKYLLTGLVDGQSYYVQASGVTVQGMTFDSNKVNFYVRLNLPEFYSIIYAENNCATATIEIKSNIITIDGEYSGTMPPVYVENTALRLMDGSVLKYNSGYELKGDFTLQYKALNYKLNTPIIDLENGTYVVKIKKAEVYTPDVPKYYGELTLNGPVMPLIINSNHFSTRNILIVIRRTGKNIFFNIVDV